MYIYVYNIYISIYIMYILCIKYVYTDIYILNAYMYV